MQACLWPMCSEIPKTCFLMLIFALVQDDEFLDKASELLTPEVMAQLENSNWKERMEGMEKFTKLVKGMAPGDIPCQICVRAVNKKPGLKEANFQVGIVVMVISVDGGGGMEKLTILVKGMVPSDIMCQICVGAVDKKPGLKEANFLVGIN